MERENENKMGKKKKRGWSLKYGQLGLSLNCAQSAAFLTVADDEKDQTKTKSRHNKPTKRDD